MFSVPTFDTFEGYYKKKVVSFRKTRIGKLNFSSQGEILIPSPGGALLGREQIKETVENLPKC